MPRPDQSFYLAHFTKDGREFRGNEVDNPTMDQMSARQRLINILTQKEILAANLNWVNKKAVCFTECPWGSLLRHAEKYSSYGIGFTKKLIYSRNGNPVLYVNPTLFRGQHWDQTVYPFLNPFVPSYASDAVKNQPPFNGRPVDYTHEREWRVTRDFKFQYKYICFVILNSVKDLEVVPDNIVNEIGYEKFVFMDTYRKIEELWPTHLME